MVDTEGILGRIYRSISVVVRMGLGGVGFPVVEPSPTRIGSGRDRSGSIHTKGNEKLGTSMSVDGDVSSSLLSDSIAW